MYYCIKLKHDFMLISFYDSLSHNQSSIFFKICMGSAQSKFRVMTGKISKKNTLHKFFQFWSGPLPVLYEVGHNDQVHGPVAQVECKEEQRKHIGGQPVKT